MQFENLKIKRIVIHELFKTDDGTAKPPSFADNLEKLEPKTQQTICTRMTEALSGQSQSLRLKIDESGPDSFLYLSEELLDAENDEIFLSQSKKFALKLNEEQIKDRRIPGGILLIFEGSVGANSLPIVGVLKADPQKAFRRTQKDGKKIVEFIENIFLSPASRLYKIGLILFEDRTKEKPDGRKIFVFDHNITVSEREKAAFYFYSKFLGCSLPNDGPYETKRFFTLTRDFIKKYIYPVHLRIRIYVPTKNKHVSCFSSGVFSDSERIPVY